MPDNTVGRIDLHYLVNNSNSKVSNSIQVKENSNQFKFSLLGTWSSNFTTGYSIIDWIDFLPTENWKFLLLLLLMFFLMSWCSSSLSWSSTVVVFVEQAFTALRMKWVILVAGGVGQKRAFLREITGTSFNLLFLTMPLYWMFCLSIVQITLVFGRLGVHGFSVSVNLLKMMVSKLTGTSCARCTLSDARGSLSGVIYCYRMFHSVRLMLVNPSLLITFAYTAWFQIIFTWVFARWEGIF